MISDLFSVTVLVGILASGIRLATPYLYAAIGETFGQRSGVLNLGVEGQMLLGAFAAFYVTLTTGKPLAWRADGHDRWCLDGTGHGVCDREFERRAGHQRYWILSLWAGDERSAFPKTAGHCGDGQRLSQKFISLA